MLGAEAIAAQGSSYQGCPTDNGAGSWFHGAGRRGGSPRPVASRWSVDGPHWPSGRARRRSHQRSTAAGVEEGWRPIPPSPFEVGAEPEYASRSGTGLYRTTPLRALWRHPPYFHEGSPRIWPRWWITLTSFIASA